MARLFFFCVDAALMEMSMAIILYCHNPIPFVWHAFFVLMQLLWKCRWQLFCISVLPQPNSICMARLFCIDAALMEMSMAIILYQCIATTQCQLSLFGQEKLSL
jgi:hypothetical protein